MAVFTIKRLKRALATCEHASIVSRVFSVPFFLCCCFLFLFCTPISFPRGFVFLPTTKSQFYRHGNLPVHGQFPYLKEEGCGQARSAGGQT